MARSRREDSRAGWSDARKHRYPIALTGWSSGIVVAPDGANRAYWLYDVQRFGRTRFELGGESEGAKPLFAIFSRSGDEIYFTLQKTLNDTVIMVKSADGFGKALPVPAPKGFKAAVDRTADGRYMGYIVLEGGLTGSANSSIWFGEMTAPAGMARRSTFRRTPQTRARCDRSERTIRGLLLEYRRTIRGLRPPVPGWSRALAGIPEWR